MKIKKSVLERIVKEEFTKHIMSLLGEAETVNAGDDLSDKEKKAEKPAGTASQNQKSKPAAPEPEQDIGADEADSEIEQDVNGDSDEDAADVTGSPLSKEIENKTVQSLTMQPKSKILPGAQEIEIQFSNSPDPLKILVSKTGAVKFFYKSVLRNKI